MHHLGRSAHRAELSAKCGSAAPPADERGSSQAVESQRLLCFHILSELGSAAEDWASCGTWFLRPGKLCSASIRLRDCVTAFDVVKGCNLSRNVLDSPPCNATTRPFFSSNDRLFGKPVAGSKPTTYPSSTAAVFFQRLMQGKVRLSK